MSPNVSMGSGRHLGRHVSKSTRPPNTPVIQNMLATTLHSCKHPLMHPDLTRLATQIAETTAHLADLTAALRRLKKSISGAPKPVQRSAGGLARAEALTPARRAEIASKAARARWGKGRGEG